MSPAVMFKPQEAKRSRQAVLIDVEMTGATLEGLPPVPSLFACPMMRLISNAENGPLQGEAMKRLFRVFSVVLGVVAVP
jgi:hypothetical protein